MQRACPDRRALKFSLDKDCFTYPPSRQFCLGEGRDRRCCYGDRWRWVASKSVMVYPPGTTWRWSLARLAKGTEAPPAIRVYEAVGQRMTLPPLLPRWINASASSRARSRLVTLGSALVFLVRAAFLAALGTAFVEQSSSASRRGRSR